MYPGIELRTMRYIVEVGNELHFSRAAEKVRVAQPSVSKQIRNVEEELGVELFKRNRKRVEITEAGQAFIENAKQALLFANRATSAAREANIGMQGKLFLGVSPSVRLDLFLRLKKSIEATSNNVELQFVPGLARDQADAIMRRELHAGLIELPIKNRGMAVLTLIREPIVLIVSRDDTLACRKTILPGELVRRPLVLLSDDVDVGHDKILLGVQSWGYEPEKIFHVPTLVQALDFVKTGEVIGALRQNLGPFDRRSVVVKTIPGLPMVDTGVVYHRQIRSSLVRNLIKNAREAFCEERAHFVGGASKRWPLAVFNHHA
jgi:DNA-binding transcriptional LysR family regulator